MGISEINLIYKNHRVYHWVLWKNLIYNGSFSTALQSECTTSCLCMRVRVHVCALYNNAQEVHGRPDRPLPWQPVVTTDAFYFLRFHLWWEMSMVLSLKIYFDICENRWLFFDIISFCRVCFLGKQENIINYAPIYLLHRV